MTRAVLVHGGGLAAARAALERLGAQVDEQASLAGVSRDCPFDLAVVDYDVLPAAGRQALTVAFSGTKRRTQLVVVSGGACRADYTTLFGTGTLTNLVARSGLEGGDFAVTVKQLLSPGSTGLAAWLPGGVGELAMEVTSSRDRAECRARALEFATTHGRSRRLAEGFCDALDEFLTNALYNGPRDADLAPRWFDRETDVTLPPGETVHVALGANARRLGVAVRDPFGTLAPQQVTDYLAKCFRRGDDQVDSKQGGAGLGLFFVFERFTHFALNIAPGRSTEAIGLLEIDPARRGEDKSFNVFCS